MQGTELALGAETTPVPVHREVDLCAQALDEHGVPVLVVQQAAQGEPDRGTSRGRLRVTLEGREKNRAMIPSWKKEKSILSWGPESLITTAISFHAPQPKR